MSFKTLLHLNLIDGNQTYDLILITYRCYNSTILIKKSIGNIKEICLKSLEMPLFFNNVRSSNNSNLCSFYFTYSSYNDISIGVSIQQFLYTQINLLITNLNTSISTALSSYFEFSFVLSVVNKYFIKKTTNASSFVLNKTILINNNLGFNSGIYSLTITTTNCFCLNVDNYINLYITNLNSGSDSNAS